jgi:hypothetical protein
VFETAAPLGVDFIDEWVSFEWVGRDFADMVLEATTLAAAAEWSFLVF